MTAYNDVIVNRQGVKFCPSISVAIQLQGNQPGLPKLFGRHPPIGLWSTK